ncbi:putative ADP-ribosylglycohydrolase [Lyophyllum shimeji]|uniref:ADP-ribosylhydrolase ARH3 n=1 Tax=Lyophyllum shimeji TaxID=47721 RepID=A0A9P3UWB6_LYOSH|nr:putative ADP-ribosylglycohydrolase [Lyophyllum shimeji]
MIPNDNFSLPPGVWTDDTSMTLCLARSLATFTPTSTSRVAKKGGFDEKHQLDMYTAWYRKGTLSAIGRCFDIGTTVRRALNIYSRDTARGGSIDDALQHIGAELNKQECAGNGSLMRVSPIGLAYWRDEGLARDYARRSSSITHPNALCQEACEVWTGAIVRIMQAATAQTGGYSKLDLVKFFAEFPYTNLELKQALTIPAGIPPPPRGKVDHEKWYWSHHPLLQLIAKTQTESVKKKAELSRTIPTPNALPSSGYALHSLAAALYCFLATESFEHGAIMAVNLGDDADTVGAIYAGLAACWYARDDGEQVDEVFWTNRVKAWKSKLVKRELVEEVADELAEFAANRT